ncbi:hypothetical protein M426DRAFT_265606 [Hypoxylon sp. CI-4A]|nr:hypothetical protein M426DRAFT_265606 [Hypoxylon sp. CI-4A]
MAYRMLELEVSGENITYVFLWNYKRFYVETSLEKLQGEGKLPEFFERFIDDPDDFNLMFVFDTWVLDAMRYLTWKLAPAPPYERWNFTLLEYYSTPTFCFQLVNKNGKLTPIQEPYDPQHHGIMGPRTLIVDSIPNTPEEKRSSSPMKDHLPQSEGVLLRSNLPDAPLILASELECDIDGDPVEWEHGPRKVIRAGTRETFFFKPGVKDNSHLREIDILSNINQSTRIHPPYLTSKLVGLVVWGENDPCLMGFLLNYVEGETIRHRQRTIQEKTKWIHQVEATLGQLHEEGIVWGGTKPNSVIINEAGDAVIVDFGGGYGPYWIKPEIQQTFEGDRLALQKMAADLDVELRASKDSHSSQEPIIA